MLKENSYRNNWILNRPDLSFKFGFCVLQNDKSSVMGLVFAVKISTNLALGSVLKQYGNLLFTHCTHYVISIHPTILIKIWHSIATIATMQFFRIEDTTICVVINMLESSISDNLPSQAVFRFSENISPKSHIRKRSYQLPLTSFKEQMHFLVRTKIYLSISLKKSLFLLKFVRFLCVSCPEEIVKHIKYQRYIRYINSHQNLRNITILRQSE